MKLQTTRGLSSGSDCFRRSLTLLLRPARELADECRMLGLHGLRPQGVNTIQSAPETQGQKQGITQGRAQHIH